MNQLQKADGEKDIIATGDEAMHPRILIGVLAAVLLAFVSFGLGMSMGAPNYGPGWWGPGMMGRYAVGPGTMGPYGYGMGSWMMGPKAAGGYAYGAGPWMMAPSWSGAALNLSVDDVKTYFGRWLAAQGDPHVKLGSVTEKDSDTIMVDILTTDKDGLAQRFALDRHTGFVQPNAE